MKIHWYINNKKPTSDYFPNWRLAIGDWRLKRGKFGAETPIPRERTDRKSGKTYWRVRMNNPEGKEVVNTFGTFEEAENHAKIVGAKRDLLGRGVAMSAEETAALTLWRQFVAGEHTAGRDVPELPDVLKPAIERAVASMGTSLSPQTVKGVRAAAHAMFAWGQKRKLVKHNPVSATEAVEVEHGEVGVLTPAQLGGLLRAALEI